MTRHFLILIFFFACIQAHAQFTVNIKWQKPGSRGDTIYYNPDNKLEWDDFKGTPTNNSIAAAITESGFGYRMSMNSVNGRTQVNIAVMCYFNKKGSWVRKGMDSDYALTHEQHHFDITYINACQFIEKLRAANFNISNYTSLVDKIHDECYEALGKMQDAYDGETMNGRLNRVQHVWNRKIDKQLAEITTN
jgi:hypothetical protein